MAEPPVLILGAGGHGKVVASTLLASGRTVLGFTDADPSKWGTRCLGIPILGGDDRLSEYPPSSVLLANGIGSIGLPHLRETTFERGKAAGYRFVPVLHPTAVLGAGVEIEEGAQVMAGAVIQPGTVLGLNSIVNTAAIVDHDCRIAAHSHIAPGATLSGSVRIGPRCHVGTGAILIQGVELGEGCLVGAGAVVLRSHSAGVVLLGIPARPKAPSDGA